MTKHLHTRQASSIHAKSWPHFTPQLPAFTFPSSCAKGHWRPVVSLDRFCKAFRASCNAMGLPIWDYDSANRCSKLSAQQIRDISVHAMIAMMRTSAAERSAIRAQSLSRMDAVTRRGMEQYALDPVPMHFVLMSARLFLKRQTITDGEMLFLHQCFEEICELDSAISPSSSSSENDDHLHVHPQRVASLMDGHEHVHPQRVSVMRRAS